MVEGDESAAATPVAKRRRRRRRVTLAKVGILAGIAASIVTVWAFVLGEDEPYREQLADAIGPLDSANDRMSEQLNALRPGDGPEQAMKALRFLELRTANARADFEDLDEPDRRADRNLHDLAALALRRQQAYTEAVRGHLERNPTDRQRDRLYSRAVRLNEIFTTLDRVSVGLAGSVSGAVDLQAWLNGATAQASPGPGPEPGGGGSGGNGTPTPDGELPAWCEGDTAKDCAAQLNAAVTERLAADYPTRRLEVTCPSSPEADDPSHYRCAVTVLDAEGGPVPIEATFVVDDSGAVEPLDRGAFEQALPDDADPS